MDESDSALKSSKPRRRLPAATSAESLDANSAGDPKRALETLQYEAGMVLGALKVLRAASRPSTLVGNAVTESAVIHTRSLCQILLNDDPTRRDITGLASLFPGYPNDAKYRELRLGVRQLRNACGEGPGSPLYKLGSRITSLRGDYNRYIEAIEQLEPEIMKVLHEIESLMPQMKIQPIP